MITFSKFPYARFGNNLWELAALNAFAKRYDTTWMIPKWEHADIFENPLPIGDLPNPDLTLKEPHFRYCQDYFDTFSKEFQTKTVDLLGYFQNEKYFDSDETKRLLTIKPELVAQVREKYSYLFTKPTIAVGVRRTDYLTNGNYHILPASYYIQALQTFNLDEFNIIFFSSEKGWPWFHFKCLPNAFFPEFESDIESFICGTLMDNWIIANSTYHFWMSYLSSAKRVIQPKQLFAGRLLEENGEDTFYIENERFEIFDYTK